jgi:hypothetical protein
MASIPHRVYQVEVWTRADGPADNRVIEAINHGREVNLPIWDMEFCDVSQLSCMKADN